MSQGIDEPNKSLLPEDYITALMDLPTKHEAKELPNVPKEVVHILMAHEMALSEAYRALALTKQGEEAKQLFHLSCERVLVRGEYIKILRNQFGEEP